MLQVDLLTLSQTRDLPGGPTTIIKHTDDVATVEPYRNEDGDVTTGGWIGYFLAYAIVAGSVLSCMYFF